MILGLLESLKKITKIDNRHAAFIMNNRSGSQEMTGHRSDTELDRDEE